MEARCISDTETETKKEAERVNARLKTEDANPHIGKVAPF